MCWKRYIAADLHARTAGSRCLQVLVFLANTFEACMEIGKINSNAFVITSGDRNRELAISHGNTQMVI